MRITGGTMRGRGLVTPRDASVRPTSDKVRQAIFNILLHHDFGVALESARVADLFAGTGALGIEALSHGASFCLFVDDAAESRALIRENVETLSLTGASKIWRRDATKLGPMAAGSGGPFEFAFLDPPYRKGLVAPALTSLRDGGWLANTAVVVAEMAEDEDVPSPDGYERIDERTYGDTRVVFLLQR
ncbi:MAG: 16S rRNA (guanine(966)-N(2))-methyltransferase RsmD [Rhizomicrobium sp.]